MGNIYYRPEIKIFHEDDWRHRGHVEAIGQDLYMGKYGASLERLEARSPHRHPPTEKHPSSQDYLLFALGG